MKIDVTSTYTTTYELDEDIIQKIANFIKSNPYLMSNNGDEYSHQFNILKAMDGLVENGEIDLNNLSIYGQTDEELSYDWSCYEQQLAAEILKSI